MGATQRQKDHRVQRQTEGSEGETKQGDLRLDAKAGTRPGRVLSSGSPRQNGRIHTYSTATATASLQSRLRNEDPTPPSLLPSKLCMCVLG